MGVLSMSTLLLYPVPNVRKRREDDTRKIIFDIILKVA